MHCDLWSKYIKKRKLFRGGNYSRAETIGGNTVLTWNNLALVAVSKPHLPEKVLWKNLTLTRKQQKAESFRLLVCMVCRIRIWTTVTGDKRVLEISKNSTFEKYRRIRNSKFEKSKIVFKHVYTLEIFSYTCAVTRIFFKKIQSGTICWPR